MSENVTEKLNTNPVGIDQISFYTSPFYLDLKLLAQAQGLQPENLYQTTGQYKMAVCPPDEDIVTLAANAAIKITNNIDTSAIEMLLIATESGIDQSKAAGIYVHQLLGLPKHCRVLELKQACYGATAIMQLARTWLNQNPNKKILLIASDIARYDLNTTAESSQGCGAVAMLLSTNPHLTTINPECGIFVENVMDFWRPNYRDNAFVDGKLSCDSYLKGLIESWKQYHKRSGRDLDAHDYFCYHTPIPRLVENAHKRLARHHKKKLTAEQINQHIGDALHYNRQIGNSYTASLYIGLVSLLENTEENLSNKRIGLYSYGSGYTAEYFSMQIQPDYQQHLNKNIHQQMLAKRKPLSYQQYLDYYQFNYPKDGSTLHIPQHTDGQFRLSKFAQHQRNYHHEY